MAAAAGASIVGNHAKSGSLPLGLTKLVDLDKVLIRQRHKFLKRNKFIVMTPSEDEILFAEEDGSALRQIDTTSARSFSMDIKNSEGKEVISLRRPCTFGTDKMDVNVCGELACIVRQISTFATPMLSINDAEDQPILRVKGPKNQTGECDYEIQTLPDHSRIGAITKEWRGLRELFIYDDHYHVTFPVDLDVRYKAAMIAACILIDYMYYSKPPKN